MTATILLQSLIILHLLQCSLSCLGGFKYHPIDAASAVRKSQEKLEVEEEDGDYYSDYEYSVRETEEARLSNATRCGRKGGTKSSVSVHVVGGEVARINELPWHVSMLRSHEGWAGCSAALLSCDPAIVVTAAHCVE